MAFAVLAGDLIVLTQSRAAVPAVVASGLLMLAVVPGRMTRAWALLAACAGVAVSLPVVLDVYGEFSEQALYPGRWHGSQRGRRGLRRRRRGRCRLGARVRRGLRARRRSRSGECPPAPSSRSCWRARDRGRRGGRSDRPGEDRVRRFRVAPRGREPRHALQPRAVASATTSGGSRSTSSRARRSAASGRATTTPTTTASAATRSPPRSRTAWRCSCSGSWASSAWPPCCCSSPGSCGECSGPRRAARARPLGRRRGGRDLPGLARSHERRLAPQHPGPHRDRPRGGRGRAGRPASRRGAACARPRRVSVAADRPGGAARAARGLRGPQVGGRLLPRRARAPS